MSERRHPNVVHVSEAPARTVEKGTRFGFTGKILGQAAGSTGLGCSWYEVPPGRTAFPTHFHCAIEEAIFVVEGEGEIRIGEARHPIRAGDFISCPAGGRETAHQIINTSRKELRYLAVSTMDMPEIGEYPDSGKFGVWVRRSENPSEFMYRYFGRKDGTLDYWDGE